MKPIETVITKYSKSTRKWRFERTKSDVDNYKEKGISNYIKYVSESNIYIYMCIHRIKINISYSREFLTALKGCTL